MKKKILIPLIIIMMIFFNTSLVQAEEAGIKIKSVDLIEKK